MTIVHLVFLIIGILQHVSTVHSAIKTSSILAFGLNDSGKFGQTAIYSQKLPVRHVILEQTLFNSTESIKQAKISSQDSLIPILSNISGGKPGQNFVFQVKYTKEGQFVNQTIFTCGNMRKLTPLVPYSSKPTPSYGFTGEGVSNFGDERLNTQEIISLSCKYSCVAITNQGLAFIKWYNENKWQLLNLNSTFKNPQTNQELNLKISQAAIGLAISSQVGEETIMLLTDSGFVLSFGFCNLGMRGDSTIDTSILSYNSFYTFPTLSNIISIGFGPGIGYAINSTGQLHMWGNNLNGILADPDTNLVLSTPKHLEFNCSMKKLSFGEAFCLYLCQDGRVFGNGIDNEGEITGVGGSIIYTPQEITSSLSTTFSGDLIIDISSSEKTSLALTSTGKLATWGDSAQFSFGREGSGGYDIPAAFSALNIVKAFFVYNIGIAITNSNETYYWGSNDIGEACLNDLWFSEKPTVIPALSTISQSHVKYINIRSSCGMILSTNGQTSSNVTYWGICSNGLSTSFSVPTVPDSPTVIDNSLFNNEVLNSFNCLKNTATVTTISGNSYGWGSGDGYILGDDADHQYPVSISANVRGIATSSGYLILVKKDGSVYAQGTPSSGSFGSPSTVKVSPPALLDTSYVTLDNSSVIQVAALESISYLLTSSGKLFAAGSNANQLIINNSTTEFDYFVRISGDDLPENHRIRKIASFSNSPLFLITYEGDAYYIYQGIHKLTLPDPNDSFVIHVNSYEFNFYIITKKGNLYAMGNLNDYLQISANPFVSSLSNMTLYATKESLGGVPYFVLPDSKTVLLAVSNTGWTCNGTDSTNDFVCSGKGACIDQEECVCKEGYSGKNCEKFTCSNILNDELNACSGKGSCVALNSCVCQQGYSGSNCENYSCFGVAFTNSNVCSGKGQCLGLDKCSCNYGYFGANCQYKSCYSDSSSVGTGSVLSIKNRLCRDINKYL